MKTRIEITFDAVDDQEQAVVTAVDEAARKALRENAGHLVHGDGRPTVNWFRIVGDQTD
jgi:hypothetical protein